MEIWINPDCSKCASALEQLDAAGADYTVRRYLEDPPDVAELREVLGRLGLEPWDITRTKEAVASTLGIQDWNREPAERERWLTALAEHPELIQRPIITAENGSSALGRDPESVQAVLASRGGSAAD